MHHQVPAAGSAIISGQRILMLNTPKGTGGGPLVLPAHAERRNIAYRGFSMPGARVLPNAGVPHSGGVGRPRTRSRTTCCMG